MKFPFIFGCIIGITSCEIEPIYPVNSGGDPFISSSFKLRTNTSEDWDDWRFYLGDSTVTVRTSTSEDWDNCDFSFNWDSGDIRTNTSEDWDYLRLTMSGVDLRIQTSTSNDWDNWDVTDLYSSWHADVKTSTSNDWDNWDVKINGTNIDVKTSTSNDFDNWDASNSFPQDTPLENRIAVLFVPIIVNVMIQQGLIEP